MTPHEWARSQMITYTILPDKAATTAWAREEMRDEIEALNEALAAVNKQRSVFQRLAEGALQQRDDGRGEIEALRARIAELEGEAR